ncbi:MAG: hypothetical protein ACP5R6_06530 [Chlorobaculum sp.]
MDCLQESNHPVCKIQPKTSQPTVSAFCCSCTGSREFGVLPSGTIGLSFFHLLQGSLYVSIGHEKVGAQNSAWPALSCIVALILLVIETSDNCRNDGISG